MSSRIEPSSYCFRGSEQQEKLKAEAQKLPKGIMPPGELRNGLFDQSGAVVFMPDRRVQRKVETIACNMERDFSNPRYTSLPQYKYLTRPVYKLFINSIGPVGATAISFLSADLIVHQFFPQAVVCLASFGPYGDAIPNAFPIATTPCEFRWLPWLTAIWIAMAVPVMFAKFLKS